MGVKSLALAALLCGSQVQAASAQAGAVVPATEATTLTGQTLMLPRDLAARATVLILGFGRHSQDATTAWEKPTRTQLAHGSVIGFYDMAVLAEIPGFLRPLVLRSIKRAVPDVLKPNFLPLYDKEDDWKRIASYAADQPDAAYLLLVDRTGHVQWSTHAAFSDAGFAELRRRAEAISAKP